MRSSAPNVKNIRNMSGWANFRKSGEANFRNLGHLESLFRSINTTREAIWVSGTGTRLKGDVETTESDATIRFVLRESSARNWALANAAKEEVHTQEAVTAEIRTAADVSEGTMINLGLLNVTNVIVTDGTDALEAGIHYDVDASAGTIEFKNGSWAQVDVTFDAPAIVSADERLMMAMMSEPDGITGELLVVQKQKRGNKRYKLEKCLINVTPDGDLSIVKEDTGHITLALSGEVLANPETPDAPFGRFIEIDA
ncbi:hypothetical protein [Sagittula sp. MA-2]|jgi:hypothetical protein|uniref:phage tail tube protein n=1 Tax=Sagittula sp. MA-2 TaxID=3048007 RepID=UPI0024C2F9DF|nr:hypothetical protein [Sagittula sp. MA-2]WHZ36491.1 hypothetical protein QNI11_05635 [Sagittula sp. MA-2]